jgi:hypothetical protein
VRSSRLRANSAYWDKHELICEAKALLNEMLKALCDDDHHWQNEIESKIEDFFKKVNFYTSYKKPRY